jgi:hypothetical protein
VGRRGGVVLLPGAGVPIPGPLHPPNGCAIGTAAVGPHAVLVLLRTCEGVLSLCHELSGRMDAGGPAANDAPAVRLSAVGWRRDPFARDRRTPPIRRLPRMSAGRGVVKHDGRRHRTLRETSRNDADPGRTRCRADP